MKQLIDRLNEPPFEPLTDEREAVLAERLTAARADGDADEAAAVRDELIERHLRLVLHIGRAYSKVLDRDEMFAVGCLALTRAADRWDPEKGRMYPWAERWITTALTRAADAQRTIRIPQQVAYKAGLAAKRITELEAELGRALTPEEAAEVHGGETLDRHPTVVASLEAPSANADAPGARTVGETVPDPGQDPHEEAERTMVKEAVETAISELSPLEQEVVRARFGIGTDQRVTLAELGAAHGVSGEAMRRVEAAALAKLRHPAALRPLWSAL